jgi:hypothetical protein
MIDRRQFARAEVKWPVTILSPEQQPPGEIKSISQVGASIYCQKLPPAGQELSLEIQPPNRQSFLVFARPIWAIDADSSESPYRFVFGVQFEYISEDDLQFLGEIVSKKSH